MTVTDIARSYIQAVQQGDQAALGRLISPDVVWHQPGRNRFSGTHKGVAAVWAMIGGMMESSQGSFRIEEATDFMANGAWVAVPLRFSAKKPGQNMAMKGVDLLRIGNGQIQEAMLFSEDQDAEDAFWGPAV